jgi:hypothetical protein
MRCLKRYIAARSQRRFNRVNRAPMHPRAPQTIMSSTRAQALLAYPRGFHSDAGDSGWVVPVSSQARAVMLSGPGCTSTVSDQGRHAHRLGGRCRLACRHVRPSSRDTSTRSMPRPSPAIPYPRIVNEPAGILSPSVGMRMSQLSGSNDNAMPVPGGDGVRVGLRGKDAVIEGLKIVL